MTNAITSHIALLINYFNILSTTIMAFFAIYGAIAIFAKKSHLNIFRRNLFIQSFCVAALFAFVLEATLFNFPYYFKYFADAELHTLEVSPSDSTIILTSDGTLAEKFTDKDSTSRDSAAVVLVSAANSVSNDASVVDIAAVDTALDKKGNGDKDSISRWGGVVFKKLDRRVTSVFIEPVFDSTEIIAAAIKLVDKAGNHMRVVTIHKGLPQTNHIPIGACGKVSELRVMLSGTNAAAGASRIAINEQIPLYFSGLRLIVVSLLCFMIIAVVYKPLREKAAYYLFDYCFDPSNRKQSAVYILSVALLILFSWVCVYTSVVKDTTQAQQYNKYLVEAIIAGRCNLEAGNPEKMLKAAEPYNVRWLIENKYVVGEDWMADWIYYKGKFYCYFGAAPALALYVPYTLITGNDLSNHGGIFIFAAFSIVLLARLWRFLVRKYMPDVRFVFYLLSFLALFFASGWFCPIRFTRFYSIVAAGGFMFVIGGLLLLFEAVDGIDGHSAGGKPDCSKLFFASMCLALAVGCRPNLLFASLMVPVILWRYKIWRYIPYIAVPYIAVAIPICLYNHARFGSIFDFGFNYNLTNLNTAAWGLLNPIGKLINTFNASLSYLFSVNRYSFFFPYVEYVPQHDRFFWDIIQFYDRGYGMINFPIVFCLFFFFKGIVVKAERPKTFYLSAAFLSIAAILILVNSYLAGFSGRYAFDFAVFIILPSLFCAYYWCSGGGAQSLENRIPVRVRQKIVYVLLTLSILVGLFLFATTVTNESMSGNPALYRYLQQSLIFMGVV